MAGNDSNEEAVDLGVVLEDELRYVFANAPHHDAQARLAAFEAALADARQAQGLAPDAPLDPAVLRDLVLGQSPLRLSGIAFSGGGIRSASFGLGVQQALARSGLLSRFDFMSGVSGGGYVLGWLLSWAYRQRGGLPVVERTLGDRAATAEPSPLQHLRRYVVYLAPQVGPMSADLWGLLAAYLRNLAVSLTFALPLILLPLLLAHVMFVSLRFAVERYGAWWQYFGFAALLLLAAAEILAMRMFARDVVPGRRADSADATRWLLWLHLTVGAALASFYLLVPRPALDWPDALKVLLAVAVFAAIAFVAARRRRLRAVQRDRDPFAFGPAREMLAGVLTAIVFVGCTGAFHALLGVSPGDGPLALAMRLPFVALAWSVTVVAAEFVHQLLHSKDMTDVDREWTVRFTGVLLLGSLTWMVGVGAVLTLPALLQTVDEPLLLPVTAAVVLLLAGLALWRGWTDLLYLLVCALLTLALSVKLFALIAPLDALDALAGSVARTAIGLLLLAAVIVLVDRFVNINRFSLHAIYRNRLCRAFLGASRPETGEERRDAAGHEVAGEERSQFRRRTPGPFQDFDADDNPRMRWLKKRERGPSDAGWLPVCFFNASLNSTWRITDPGRPPKAYPFAFSQFWCGSPETGYCRTEAYSSAEGGISLGTAMATSGAAVASLSGRDDNRLLAFVKTVFNLRLGWWLGNPNDPECRAAAAPRFSMVAFCAELFGASLRTRDWINLSDGGHFENLGVFPLLQRGCTDIVAIDATADPQRSAPDLATLMRMARAELNVEIVRDSAWRIGLPELGERGRHCTVFRILYPGGRIGRLLYVKTALYEGGAVAPVDAVSYYMQHRAFPHESTVNQFFTEAQFESYRHLGEETLLTILAAASSDGAGGGPASLDALFDGARRHAGPVQ